MEGAFRRMSTKALRACTARGVRCWSRLLPRHRGGGGRSGLSLGVAAAHNDLLAGVAFSIGFLALLLGRSELFTEGFLVPVTTVAAKCASVGQLLKLWSGTLIANLVGGWAIMWLVMRAYPRLHNQTIESAAQYATAPMSTETVTLAFLGGMIITLMTRMQHGTDSVFGKIAAAIAGPLLLAGLQMFHSILDSLLIFGALTAGNAPFGYGDWIRWFGYTTVGNMLGGLLLVTLLRLLRSRTAPGGARGGGVVLTDSRDSLALSVNFVQTGIN